MKLKELIKISGTGVHYRIIHKQEEVLEIIIHDKTLPILEYISLLDREVTYITTKDEVIQVVVK